MIRVVYCFAVGLPEPRAECVIGNTKVIATTPQMLAQGLLDLGAPEDLEMVFRMRVVMHPDGYYETGYSRGTAEGVAAGEEFYVETEPKYSERFSWLQRFGTFR